MKRILITGKNSYIGKSLENYLMLEPGKYLVNTLDLKDDKWRDFNFSNYDVVFHVAGIAHVSLDPNMEELYYKVNRDLAIETAKKSKIEGVKQFIFMSSIIVYGKEISKNKVIDKSTVPIPLNFYGKSKLQAEEGILEMNSSKFKIIILRPPMIYGKGSKGNYLRLSQLAKVIPVFPDFDNQRSMLHIDNLCEYIKLVIENDDDGIHFPQNEGYVKTSDMVRTIAKVHGKKIILTRILNPFVKLMLHFEVVNKVFGNLAYDKSLSKFKDYNYQVRNFEESIKLTEVKKGD